MIKSIAVICFCFSFCYSQGQSLTTSSKTKNRRPADSVEINFGFSDHYFFENSSFQKQDIDGYFRLSLSGGTPKVVLLRYREKERWILLSSHRILSLKTDTSNAEEPFIFSGKAVAENELLQQLTPKTGMWFSSDINRKGHVYVGNNSYVNWSLDSVLHVLLPLVKESLDSSLLLVKKASLPNFLKEAINAEVKYYFANELNKFIHGWALVMEAKLNQKEYNRVQRAELPLFGMPGEEELDISQSAKAWVNSYLEIKFSERLDSFNTDPDKQHAKNVFGDATGLSWEEQQKLMTDIGQSYPILVIERRNILPAYAEERRLADLTFRGANDDLQFGEKILHDNLIKDFPNSRYIAICKIKIASVQRLKEQNGYNPDIHIRTNYRSITTLADLIAPYLGKVIYLDFWGTWCHPCIEEMHHTPSLKQHFQSENIVYLYLDMDEDKDDQRWKDFIYTHNLVGEHVRMTSSQISKIREGVGDYSQSYPRYYIIDKDGSVFLNNANRPSAGEDLYAQLAIALNK
jgi:thiol-disulfide isomerase/thioredoxin